MKSFLFLLTTLTVFISFVTASQTPWPVPETLWLNRRANATAPGSEWDYVCQSERAADYYGIGVRLGIYFSWFTAWLANVAVPSEIAGAIDQNSIFLFANVVALVRCTITFQLTQLDSLILMHLSSGTIFSVLSLWGYRTCHYKIEGPKGIRHFGGFGTHMRLLLAFAVSTYGMWFWLIGIKPDNTDLMKIDGPCLTIYTFMFSKVNSAGGIRIFYIIICLCCTLYWGIMLIVSSLAGWSRLNRMIKLWQSQRWRTSSRLHFATGFNYGQLRRIFFFLRIGNMLYMIYSMLLVEFTLNYNHVRAVLGPGGRIYYPAQLIPMIIGAFSLCRMIYKAFQKSRDPDDEPSVEKEASLGGTWQKFPTSIFKLFAPPTLVAHGGAADTTPPEDTDLDPLMEDEHPCIRYLVAWLPWLSLLSKWRRKAKLSKEESTRPRSHRRDIERNPGSDTTTLPGSPHSTTYVEVEKGWKGSETGSATHVEDARTWGKVLRKDINSLS